MNDIVLCYELSLSLSDTHLINLYVRDVVNFFSLGIFNFSSSVHVVFVVMGGTVALNFPKKNTIIIIIIISNIGLNYNRKDKKLYVTSQLYNDNYIYGCHTSLFAQSNLSAREIHKRGHVCFFIPSVSTL